jgi:hypothetical protein
MTSYISSLLTTTTSRVASIRQNLLPSENDGDTEDDTHLCRVLRAYYTEKGRPFPAWLPPDPKAPPPVVVQPLYSQTSVGSRYGGLQNQGGAGGNALSSLWDSQPQPQQQDQSLRQGKGARPGPTAGGSRPNPFKRSEQASVQEEAAVPRLLPSQSPYTQQNVGSRVYGRGDSQTPPGSSGGISAKQRLRGGKKLRGDTVSPASSASSMAEPVQQAQRGNSYGSTRNSSNYEDRFMPSDNGYGGGRSERPFVAATAPWASSESEFSGGSYAGGGPRRGLPRGPAPERRR